MNPFAVLAQLTTVVAREYLRVSKDTSGRSRSTVEQHSDLDADARENSWTLGECYTDSAIGASKYSRKRRGDFEALIGDLRADEFGAQVLLLWETSRGSRRTEEWLDLLNLCAARGVFIWVHTHTRLYDPNNGRDRETLLTDAVKAEAQAWEISQRTSRAGRANVADGKPAGPCPWGYERTYDPKTRALVSQLPKPGQAEHVQSLYTRLYLGHTFYAIAKDWDAAGIRNKSGRPFSAPHLRAMVLSPTYAGMRGHFPGRSNGSTPRATPANLTPGMWPGLVTLDVWWAVHDRLHQPKVNDGGRPRVAEAKHLLSTIVRCGVCGGPLSSGGRNGRAEYGCRARGHVRMVEQDLDTYLTGLLLDRLSRPDVVEGLRSHDETEAAAVVKAREELAAARAEHEELGRAVGAGELSALLAARSEPMILARIEAAEGKTRALDVPSALRGLIAPGADVAARWAEAPISTRRAVLRALFCPRVFGEARVMPATRRGGGVRVPADERVILAREGDAVSAA